MSRVSIRTKTQLTLYGYKTFTETTSLSEDIKRQKKVKRFKTVTPKDTKRAQLFAFCRSVKQTTLYHVYCLTEPQNRPRLPAGLPGALITGVPH